jgi:HAE1 family hydrophobic/amphiphilic exporter-1
MQILLGSAYVNDFDFNNRSYRVYVQADQQFRAHRPTSRSTTCGPSAGRMMPLSSVVSVRETTARRPINH